MIRCVDDGKCSMKLLTTNRHGMSDTTSWYKAWEAVTAICFMCNAVGRRGTFRGLGKICTNASLMGDC